MAIQRAGLGELLLLLLLLLLPDPVLCASCSQELRSHADAHPSPTDRTCNAPLAASGTFGLQQCSEASTSAASRYILTPAPFVGTLLLHLKVHRRQRRIAVAFGLLVPVAVILAVDTAARRA